MKDEDVKVFKMVICKLDKHKLRDGGFGLWHKDVSIREVDNYLNYYYTNYTRGKIVRYEGEFYAVLERGSEFSILHNIDGHYVRLIPIKLSKYVGALIVGDTEYV